MLDGEKGTGSSGNPGKANPTKEPKEKTPEQEAKQWCKTVSRDLRKIQSDADVALIQYGKKKMNHT